MLVVLVWVHEDYWGECQHVVSSFRRSSGIRLFFSRRNSEFAVTYVACSVRVRVGIGEGNYRKGKYTPNQIVKSRHTVKTLILNDRTIGRNDDRYSTQIRNEEVGDRISGRDSFLNKGHTTWCANPYVWNGCGSRRKT